MGQESGHRLPGCPWVRFLHKPALKVPTMAAVSSEGSAGAGSTPKLSHIVAGKIHFPLGLGLNVLICHWLLTRDLSPWLWDTT